MHPFFVTNIIFLLLVPSTSSTLNIGEQGFGVAEQRTLGEIESVDETSGNSSIERPTYFSSLSDLTIEEQEASGEQDKAKLVCFFL